MKLRKQNTAQSGSARITIMKDTLFRSTRHRLLAYALATYALAALICGGQLSAAVLYVSSPSIGTIYKIAPDGTQTTFAQVGMPRGLAFDAAGVLYVADSSSGKIIKITPTGTQSTFASGLSNPVSLVLDSSGNLFVADTGANAIYKFTPAGARSTFASNLQRPAGLAFDAAGNLYESDGNSGNILKFTPSGTQSTFATGLNKPAGLDFDNQGFLYEADQGTNALLKFAPNGTHTVFAALDSSVDNAPVRPIVDTAGNIYLSVIRQDSTGIIYKFTPAGVRSTFATENTIVSFMVLAPTDQLLNIATRLGVGTGGNVLIAGFIVTGQDPKTVLIRGIGPSLTGAGVPNALANPTLELHQGNTTLATNDNWKRSDQTGQSQEAAIRATTVPPKNDLESAILVTLNPGAYTAILGGKNATTGVGLVEVYDLARTANSQLANISTRGFVDTGDNVMIGGLIVGVGNSSGHSGSNGSSERVIIRALGPSLGAAGVKGALADPTLELHDGNGATLATNDNWKTASDGSSQQAAIEATTIPPSNDLESALIATLVPGNYTAIVRGTKNSAGVGLVEVYNLQ
jgi:sugar lactone lactonase YvrE